MCYVHNMASLQLGGSCSQWIGKSLGIRTSFRKEICLQCKAQKRWINHFYPVSTCSKWLLYNLYNCVSCRGCNPPQNRTPNVKSSSIISIMFTPRHLLRHLLESWISGDAHHWCATLPFIIHSIFLQNPRPLQSATKSESSKWKYILR